MGYVYLLCVAMMFSFGGTCVKLISPYFSAEYITLFRFVIGVMWLLILKKIKGQKSQADWKVIWKELGGWIVFGAAAKWMAYLTENYALSHGPSYGNIVVQPMQTIFLTLMSVVMFKEKITKKQMVCIGLCMAGVFLISWNGRSMEEFIGENFLLLGLFLISGICAGSHVLTQKMVADKMDIIDSNLVIFAISAGFAIFPVLPSLTNKAMTGVRADIPCVAAILVFGFITGMGFYLNAKAIPLVPFYMVPIIQSTMVIFSIMWGVLFFHEKISGYIVGGTVTFLVGLLGLQLMSGKAKIKNAEYRE